MKSKIYAFVNGSAGLSSDVLAAAVAEDGTILPASHMSSNPSWARFDMGADGISKRKHEVYAAHYPEGFEVVWVDSPQSHPELSAIIARLNAQASTVSGE